MIAMRRWIYKVSWYVMLASMSIPVLLLLFLIPIPGKGHLCFVVAGVGLALGGIHRVIFWSELYDDSLAFRAKFPRWSRFFSRLLALV